MLSFGRRLHNFYWCLLKQWFPLAGSSNMTSVFPRSRSLNLRRLRCDSSDGVHWLNSAAVANHPPSGWALTHGQTEFWQVWFSGEEHFVAKKKQKKTHCGAVHLLTRTSFLLFLLSSPRPSAPVRVWHSAAGGRGQEVLLRSQAGLLAMTSAC